MTGDTTRDLDLQLLLLQVNGSNLSFINSRSHKMIFH